MPNHLRPTILHCIAAVVLATTSLVAGAENKVILGLFAHPDDEVIAGATLAKYAESGHTVYLAVATDGQHGVTEHANIPAGAKLAKIRAKEAACACKQLGIKPPIMLDFEDGTLISYENQALLYKRLKQLFFELKPDIVITFGPDGAYGHPDHRTLSNVATEIMQTESSKLDTALYYVALPLIELADQKPETSFGSFFLHEFNRTDKALLPIRIALSNKHIEQSRQALLCHQSQFTKEDVNDLFNNITKNDKTHYFRPWAYKTASHQNSFF